MTINLKKKKKKEKKKRLEKYERKNSGETSTKEVLEVEKDIWKSRVRKDASTKDLESCN